ncbi:hypothetical protein [Halorientalis marina]|jgi:hypothetical protein|uniref:hypothetical protein n=1 Tax=Halorientalis marina TaxID=2931976 RepID=UPI001FF33D64|nr:hypothetical protein [Halorientalis marina]
MAGLSRQSDSIGDVVQRNLASGALVGAGAYVTGYVLTFLLTVVDGVETSGSVSTWKAVGWVFYAAHNARIEATASSDLGSRSETVDLFEQGVSGLGSTVPQFVYFLVPVVVLLGAGYVAYQRADTSRLETPQVAAVGATLVTGYIVLGLLGAFLFEASGDILGAELAVGPELATAVVIAGLVYPLVLGAVGAVLANAQDGGGKQAGAF